MVYVSPSDEIQQSLLSAGKWKDSPVGQASKLPSDGSFLSISMYFLPKPLQDGIDPPIVAYMQLSKRYPEPATQEPGPPSKVSPRSFSSVATYQNNVTLFTIDLDPRLESNQEKRSNKNLLANFDGTQDVNYDVPIGFACDYNLPIPRNSTHYYTRCFMGNSGTLAPDNSDEEVVKIFDYIWEYPVAEAIDRSDQLYNYTTNDNLNSESITFFRLLAAD